MYPPVFVHGSRRRSQAHDTSSSGQDERLVNFGRMAVASLARIAPVYLIGLFAQRWLVSELTAGSIK
jgi:ABC-type glycerol-3-phosphate transport system permease component